MATKREANTIELGNYAVEKLPQTEYVKRVSKDGTPGVKVYVRGPYDATQKKYELIDANDHCRCIYVKRGTLLHAGFSY